MGLEDGVAKGLDLFKTLVFDTAVEAAIAAWAPWISKIPFLKGIITGFTDKLYAQLAGSIIFGTVLFVNVQHRRAFDAAQTDLKGIALTKGIDSPEFKEAHERERQALKKFGQRVVVERP